MTRLVVDGAVCRCTLGTHPASLMAKQCPATSASGSTSLNIADTVFRRPFGECERDSTKCIACTPSPEGLWSDGTASIQFGPQPVLVETATLKCTFGGTISVKDPGQDTTRFDATYVREDGTVAILRDVTQDELERYKAADELQAMNEKLTVAAENPLALLPEAVGNLIKGAGGAAEQRNNYRRAGIPIRARGR